MSSSRTGALRCSDLMHLRGTQQASNAFLRLVHIAPAYCLLCRDVANQGCGVTYPVKRKYFTQSHQSFRLAGVIDPRPWHGGCRSYSRHETDTCHCEQRRESTRLRPFSEVVNPPPQVQARRSARLIGPSQPPVFSARCRRASHTNRVIAHVHQLSSRRITPESPDKRPHSRAVVPSFPPRGCFNS